MEDPIKIENFNVGESLTAVSAPEKDFILNKLIGNHSSQHGRFVLAALSSIPWVGGVLSGIAGLSAEKEQKVVNQLIALWLKEHESKMVELGVVLDEITTRFDELGEEIKERTESEEYLALVRRAFQSWDKSDTKEKKQMIKKLIMNAGGTNLCQDDLVRLFLNWIDLYHEAHFMVIREVYKNKGITRAGIWDNIHPGDRPADDSPEADLFKYLINELTLGYVIRQEREVNAYHQFVKKQTKGIARATSSNTMTSAFDDIKQYELTELGSQFVHYVMNDLVKRIE